MINYSDDTNNISQFEFNPILFSYLGIEFENICEDYIHSVFDSCNIKVRNRYYYGEPNNENYIIPDVLVSNITKKIAKICNISQNEYLIIDFKRSISAISQKDINYLNIIPNSKLILCILQEEGKKDWNRQIEKIVDDFHLSKFEEGKILSRIDLWPVKEKFSILLPQNKNERFLERLRKIERLDNIKAIKNLNFKIIKKINNLNITGLQEKLILLVEKFDEIQLLKYLLILDKISTLIYFTKEDLISVMNYSQPIIEDVLNDFIDMHIVSKKIISAFSPHLYYFFSVDSPDLVKYFDITGQLEKAKGLQLLAKNNKIPINIINECNFDEFREYFKIDKRIALGTIFKISYLFEKENILTPEEVTSTLGINQGNTSELLRLMASIGFLYSYKIDWETSVKYYSRVQYKTTPIKYIQKYLPDLIKLSLTQIKETTNLKINSTLDLKNLFGKNWYSILLVFGIFVKNKENYLDGYNPETVIDLLRMEQLNHSFTKVRKMMAQLSRKNINLLAIERENLGTVGRIKKYYLPNQNQRLFQQIQEKSTVKAKQIEVTLEILNQSIEMTTNEVKEALKDGWTSKLRIYYILKTQEKFSELFISVEEAMDCLEKEGFKISRTNFIRYISVFSRTPFKLVELVRTKQSKNSPIAKIKIL